MWTELVTMRDALAAITGVETCKIGDEKGKSPADYPAVRLIPTRFSPDKSYNFINVELQIRFAMDIVETQEAGGVCGLEYVYQKLLALDEDIKKIVKAQGGRYIDTITDQDLLNEPFKYMALRCEIRAARPETA